jgi:hypothetical protein
VQATDGTAQSATEDGSTAGDGNDERTSSCTNDSDHQAQQTTEPAREAQQEPVLSVSATESSSPSPSVDADSNSKNEE